MKNKLFLLDLTNLMYRYHFGFIRQPLRTKDGHNTSAIYGTINFVCELIDKYNAKNILAAIDVKAKTYRHDIFPEYKSGRDETPDELLYQIPYIIEILGFMGIKVLGIEGIEADDVIGTTMTRMKNEFDHFVVVTTDKDMAQLLNSKSIIMSPKREDGKFPEFNIKDIENKLKIDFEKIIDYYALIGDKVDAIPGIEGIGPVSAQKRIKIVNDIESREEVESKITNEKIRMKIINNRDNIKLYKELLKIKTDADFELNRDDLSVKEMDKEKLIHMFKKFELYSFIEKMNLESKDSLSIFEKGIETKNIEDILKFDIIVILSEIEHICVAAENVWGIFKRDIIESKINILKEKKIIVESLRTIEFIMENLIPDNIYDISILRNLQMRSPKIENVIKEYLGEQYKSNDIYENAVMMAKAGRKFIDDCEKHPNIDIYRDIELPIVPAIIKMEQTGIKVNREFFIGKKTEYIEQINKLKKEIYGLASEEFNINSPKQLQKILFDKLKIQPIKKTKTGYSTDSEVLKELALRYEIAEEILLYRERTKLLTGFVEPILSLSLKTNYIHTRFEQSYAATGRFSSKNPNMQNIPQEIRKGFIPSGNRFQLYAIDYSQIELRILAYISEDENMLCAFKNGRDIHNETAMRIFNADENQITAEMRKIAKIINFSIIYGKTAFGLSKELNISRKEATAFIDRYFIDYQGVRRWMDKAINNAREKGFSETLFGRTRYIPEINSRNKMVRSQAERIAVNTPIQGTAADIIKIAIKNIYDFLKSE
ncbi:hypothetical protein KAU15_00175, partial [candidate division WOR-3 bacterium]|nr:hypothetical protein [candidate division WOR-3 bacterium]